jgi:predicted nuclease with TOPRIM domain
MSTRRLDMSVEQLKNKTTNQLSELGKKGDAINRLKIERDALNVDVIALKTEVIALKTQVDALKEPLTAAGKEVEAEAVALLRHLVPHRVH